MRMNKIITCSNKIMATEVNYHDNQSQINVTTQTSLHCNLRHHFFSLRLKGPVIYRAAPHDQETINIVGFPSYKI